MVYRPHYLNVERVVEEWSFYGSSEVEEVQREVTTRYLGRKKLRGEHRENQRKPMRCRTILQGYAEKFTNRSYPKLEQTEETA